MSLLFGGGLGTTQGVWQSSIVVRSLRQPPAFPRRVAPEVCKWSAPRKIKDARDPGVLAQTSLRSLRKRLIGPTDQNLSRDFGGAMLFDEAPLGLSKTASPPFLRRPARDVEACSARPPVD